MKPHINTDQLKDLTELGYESFKRHFKLKPGSWFKHPDFEVPELYAPLEFEPNFKYLEESAMLPNIVELLEYLIPLGHSENMYFDISTNKWHVGDTDGSVLVDLLWVKTCESLNNDEMSQGISLDVPETVTATNVLPDVRNMTMNMEK